MAISLLSNLGINMQEPDVTRQQFSTLDEMKNFSENYLPPMYDAFCLETQKKYRYIDSNSVDATTGKWREINGGDVDLTNYYNKTETDDLLDEKVDKEEDKGLSTNDFTNVYKLKIGDTVLTTTADNLSDAINELKTAIDDTTLADKVDDLEEWLEKLDNADKTVEGSIRYLDEQVYSDAKDYTDERVEALNKKKSIACDEKPVYTKSTDPLVSDTITYKLDGTSHTINADEIWFYYMAENDLNGDGIISANEEGLAQTIWIDQVEFTIMSFGIDMTEYVNKNIDVVSTYTGEEVETSKIPNLASMKALETKIDGKLDEKIDTDDIEDSLTSTSTDKVLSANQGKVIKDELDKKLDIEQGADNANKRVVTDSSGNITLEEQGEINASSVTYENDTYTTWTNVKKAIDGLIAKVDYVPPSITSFTMTPSTTTYEVGQTVTSLDFAWSYNKDITTQTLTDVTLTDETDRSGSWTGSLATNKTFTLNCGDGQNSASKSISISFQNKIYYGSASTVETYDSAFILGLSKSQFATTYKGKYAINVGNGQFAYFCVPTSFNCPSECYIGGFLTTLVKEGSISFVNSKGYASTYDIFRTGRSGLGSITLEFK